VGIWALYLDQFDDADKLPNVLTGFTADNNKRGVVLHTYGPFQITNASVNDNEEEGIAFNTRAVAPGQILVRNVVANNNPYWNLWAISFASDPLDLRIEDCEFSGSTGSPGYGLYMYAATGFAWSDVSVVDCKMTANNAGVYLRAGSATATLTGVEILCCSIDSNGTGILITDYAAAGNSAHFSSISGNTAFGVQNNHASDFDARNNWWGAEDGPGGVYSGSGDDVSANVLYDPWIKNAAATTATGTGPVLFSPGAGNIVGLTPVAVPAGAPAGIEFPHGMFSFQICCLNTGRDGDTDRHLALKRSDRHQVVEIPLWLVVLLAQPDDNGDNVMVIRSGWWCWRLRTA
jgi:hypothetical protein